MKLKNQLNILLILIFFLGILPTAFPVQSVAPTQTLSFEGRIWTKQIRNSGSPSSTSYYSTEYGKVEWTNVNELTALEYTATYQRYVGFTTDFSPVGSSQTISFDGKVTAGHESPRRMYIGVFDWNWYPVGSLISTTALSYTTITNTFTGLEYGEQYHLFFFYSDGWSADWDTKIYVKNFHFGPYIPAQQFVYNNDIWTKQIRNQGNPASTDYYNNENSKVIWTYSTEMTALESSATYQRYVGFSRTYTASTNQITVNFDAYVTAGHSSPRRMYLAIFDGNWNQVGSSQSLTNTAYQSFTWNFIVTSGQTYNVFFFYSDSWSADWDTKIYVKNVAISSTTPPEHNVLVLIHGFASEPGAMREVADQIGSGYDDVYYVDLYSLNEYYPIKMKILANPTQTQLDNSKNTKTDIVFHLPVPIGPYTSLQSEIDLMEYTSLSGLLYHAILDNIHTNSGEINNMDIVAHSMGGLVTRSMIKYYVQGNTIGGFTIKNIATLGTPNHGTQIAKWAQYAIDAATSPSAATKDLLDLMGVDVDDIVKGFFNNIYPGLGDAVVVLSNGDFLLGHLGQMVPDSTFLTNLNNGDETPYNINWITQRGKQNTDGNLNIDISVTLEWCDAPGILPDYPCLKIHINVSLPDYTDIVWGQVNWENREYCIGICETFRVPTGISEADNDGVVDYSSVPLSGAIANYNDNNAYWTHSELHQWTTATYSSTLRGNLVSWFTP